MISHSFGGQTINIFNNWFYVLGWEDKKPLQKEMGNKHPQNWWKKVSASRCQVKQQELKSVTSTVAGNGGK